MSDFNLKVNDRIEVIGEEKTYKTLIIDIQDDFLRINLPVADGEYLMVKINEKLEINSYLDESRCFKFYCNVISRGKEGNIIYYEVSKPFDMKKIQRRNFFRVNVLNTIDYKIITNINKEEVYNIEYKEAVMLDLSGGGLKLKCKEDIKLDDLLLINLIIGEVQIELKCDIVRIENTEDRGKIYGLRFLDIKPYQTDIIIRELFEIIRKQRAKL